MKELRSPDDEGNAFMAHARRRVHVPGCTLSTRRFGCSTNEAISSRRNMEPGESGKQRKPMGLGRRILVGRILR